ncbi:hypothetical protein BKA82DRAFT_1003243 [Pisolithus tinctorius]|uniref:Uncharacterized protein n=1 Tax=Pisolithus tinctorius Marx 270 TaxID=870435 RepID=A0A0C3NJP0_PISTI|nr:hypothetical protein BKA82DRAFT_1003243 [Pisolithus tinctorius]KIO01200.1 hypothetical protein M404DRAFT_1003243 [Pisolithus tinctorius Marx 270]
MILWSSADPFPAITHLQSVPSLCSHHLSPWPSADLFPTITYLQSAVDDDPSPSMSSNSPLPDDSVAVPSAFSEDPSCDDSADMSSEDLEVVSFDDPDAVTGSSVERRAS